MQIWTCVLFFIAKFIRKINWLLIKINVSIYHIYRILYHLYHANTRVSNNTIYNEISKLQLIFCQLLYLARYVIASEGVHTFDYNFNYTWWQYLQNYLKWCIKIESRFDVYCYISRPPTQPSLRQMTMSSSAAFILYYSMFYCFELRTQK